MKPHYSKANITTDEKAIIISIPNAGWDLTAGVVLGATIIIGGITIINFFFGESTSVSLLLLLGAAISFVCLQWFLKGITEIRVEQHSITRTWKLFGKNYSKSRPTDQLKYVNEEKVFEDDEDGAYIYGIVMHFENDKKLIFGTRLDDQERKWILNELLNMTEGSIQRN